MQEKNVFLKVLSALLSLIMLFSVGCGGNSTSEESGNGNGHTHVFDCKVSTEEYLKNQKNCKEAEQYYYSCECGAKGEESYKVGVKGTHNYTAEIAGEKYLKTAATCQTQAVYYTSCTMCGVSSAPYGKTFSAGELGEHACVKEVPSGKFLKEEANFDSPALYYKSCTCGEIGTETFYYGSPRQQLTEEEKKGYKPVSLTMSLYDAENSVYGFTYNTQNEPLRPVIQIEKGETLTGSALEFGASYSKWTSYDANDNSFDYYIVKVEVELEPLETYTYRVYDKYAETGSETVTFTSRDTESERFTFSHMSDTQSKNETNRGQTFGWALGEVQDVSDFVLHTGDVVEYSKYEYQWTEMLDGNFEYLSKMPVMAIAGNHDTTFKSGNRSREIWKHFNNKLPTQDSVGLGYYYSFVYGNAKFIMLNTNSNGENALETAQYEWLIEELENNDSTWTIVAMHCPVYSVGHHAADPAKNAQTLALQAQLKGVFAEYGVDLVLQGHDHLLSRTKPIGANGVAVEETWKTENGIEYSIDPNGVIYAMSGTTGTSSASIVGDTADYLYAIGGGTGVWSNITIDGNTLTYEAKVVGGTTRQWGIKKTV